MKKNIVIENKAGKVSLNTKLYLEKKFKELGYSICGKISKNTELIICIGGDGSLLRTLYKHSFPNVKIAGINTGTLGFFQEFRKDDLDEFIMKYKRKEYVTQKYSPIECTMYFENKQRQKFKALNEITVKGTHTHATVVDVFIGKSQIETFYGDGIVVSSAAGSTAYNYALQGSIIDHRLSVLQLTPIAPIKSSEYSSFTSSIILPSSEKLMVIPRKDRNKKNLIAGDGIERNSSSLKKLEIELSKDNIKLLRFKGFDFWDKVKTKLL